MADVEDATKDQGSDIRSAIFRLRVEFGEESKKLAGRIRELKETLDDFVDHFDEYLQKTRKKVAEIEAHLKIPSA